MYIIYQVKKVLFLVAKNSYHNCILDIKKSFSSSTNVIFKPLLHESHHMSLFINPLSNILCTHVHSCSLSHTHFICIFFYWSICQYIAVFMTFHYKHCSMHLLTFRISWLTSDLISPNDIQTTYSNFYNGPQNVFITFFWLRIQSMTVHYI